MSNNQSQLYEEIKNEFKFGEYILVHSDQGSDLDVVFVEHTMGAGALKHYAQTQYDYENLVSTQ